MYLYKAHLNKSHKAPINNIDNSIVNAALEISYADVQHVLTHDPITVREYPHKPYIARN